MTDVSPDNAGAANVNTVMPSKQRRGNLAIIDHLQ